MVTYLLYIPTAIKNASQKVRYIFFLFNKVRYLSRYVVIIQQALLDISEKNSLQISV